MHRTRLVALVIAAALLLPGLATLASAQHCVVDLVVLNRNRHVAGDIGAECSGPHSAPFGNWGTEVNVIAVDRTHSGRETGKRDGFQFSGWRVEHGWLQWNSCTTDESRFPLGDVEYYNAEDFTEQRAWPEVVNVSHTLRGFMRGPIGVSCAEVPYRGTLGIGTVVLEVHELDPVRFFGVTWKMSSALVATLLYDDVEANVQCTDDWLCSGESPVWVRPASGAGGVDDVYAELKIAVRLRGEE